MGNCSSQWTKTNKRKMWLIDKLNCLACWLEWLMVWKLECIIRVLYYNLMSMSVKQPLSTLRVSYYLYWRMLTKTIIARVRLVKDCFTKLHYLIIKKKRKKIINATKSLRWTPSSNFLSIKIKEKFFLPMILLVELSQTLTYLEDFISISMLTDVETKINSISPRDHPNVILQ